MFDIEVYYLNMAHLFMLNIGYNLEYFNYVSSRVINDSWCTREIKSRISMAKAAFNKKKNLFTSKLNLNWMKKLVKCNTSSTSSFDAET
jgi:hypothetical protein